MLYRSLLLAEHLYNSDKEVRLLAKSTKDNVRTVDYGGKTYTYVSGINRYECNGKFYVYTTDGRMVPESNVSLKVLDNKDDRSMDDGGKSEEVASYKYKENGSKKKNLGSKAANEFIESNNLSYLKRYNHIHNAGTGNGSVHKYDRTYRFGYFEPSPLTDTREFLFFTRPDLYIVNTSGSNKGKLRNELMYEPFFTELYAGYKDIIGMLQSSYNPGTIKSNDPFNHLLQNQVINTLDVPAMNSELIETPVNSFGVGYGYRGSSEASDDKPTFSLEFKDSRWLEVYRFFKAYEKYETIKHHGNLRPRKEYILSRVIHDAFAIFKILTLDDMETIVYFGKMYGVTPKSLPRDVFNTTIFDSGLTYSIDFEAAFYEDMEPDIIADFNALATPALASKKYNVGTYNDVLDIVDHRPANVAYIERVKSEKSPAGFVYKLRWKGDYKG